MFASTSNEELHQAVPTRPSRRSFQPQDTQLLELKLAIVGVGRTGKSSIIRQFCENRFSEETDSTIEDWYQKKILVEDDATGKKISVSLDLVDTSGDVLYISISQSVLSRCDGFLLVYNVANTHSFILSESFFKKIKESLLTNSIPVVLVANMCDLEEQKVDYKAGNDLAIKMGCPYQRVSAATRENIDEVFETLVKEILKQRRAPLVLKTLVFD
jgi:Ras family protein